MNIYKFELKRSIRTPGFYIALLIGSIIAIADWCTYALKFSRHIYTIAQFETAKNPMSYPAYVYESWIGGGDSKFSELFFLILPLLVVMPYATSFYSDNKSNFINFICTRTRQKSYFRAKFFATFLTGGMVAILPLILNFLLCATVLPCVLPQIAAGRSLMRPNSTFSNIYYNHPLIYVIFSILIIFVFAGTLAVLALSVVFYAKYIYSVMLFPFVLCLVIMSGADLLERYAWQPMNFMNPAYNSPRLFSFFVETAILLAIVLWEFLHKGQEQDILS